MDFQECINRVSHWYLIHARKLPWRETSSPYPIWISEVMLQQTRVATVLPYYERFLARFPTLHDLAKASLSEVLTLWSGLGYYSRAKNLHRGARHIVEKCNGFFPVSREELLKVPGIGPYTAGALLSIAYNMREPLVDGNVQRVFARFFGERRSLGDPNVQKRFWRHALDCVQKAKSPRILNQALMELGATVCTKQNPLCELCPLQSNCVAFARGWQAKLPLKKARKRTVNLWWLGIVYESNGKVYLCQNGKRDWWSGLWSFPYHEVPNRYRIEGHLVRLAKLTPHISYWRMLGIHQHTVTHHRIYVTSYLLSLEKRPRWDGRWEMPSRLSNLPVSSLVKKVALHLC